MKHPRIHFNSVSTLNRNDAQQERGIYSAGTAEQLVAYGTGGSEQGNGANHQMSQPIFGEIPEAVAIWHAGGINSALRTESLRLKREENARFRRGPRLRPWPGLADFVARQPVFAEK